jgi:hypothetical protein
MVGHCSVLLMLNYQCCLNESVTRAITFWKALLNRKLVAAN